MEMKVIYRKDVMEIEVLQRYLKNYLGQYTLSKYNWTKYFSTSNSIEVLHLPR